MSTAIPPSFKFNDVDIPVNFGYKEVVSDFKKMGLDLFGLFEGQEVLMTILANDRVMLQVWLFYVKPYCSDEDAAIAQLRPHEMHKFKEAFWQQVVNFTQPQMRPLLVAMWKQVKERLDSPEEILRSLSSDSSEEQE